MFLYCLVLSFKKLLCYCWIFFPIQVCKSDGHNRRDPQYNAVRFKFIIRSSKSAHSSLRIVAQHKNTLELCWTSYLEKKPPDFIHQPSHQIQGYILMMVMCLNNLVPLLLCIKKPFKDTSGTTINTNKEPFRMSSYLWQLLKLMRSVVFKWEHAYESTAVLLATFSTGTGIS